MAQTTDAMPQIQFSHMGICCADLPTMVDFYTRVLGFTMTDRGNAIGLDLVFLSREPSEHHQIVLTSGRPPGLRAEHGQPPLFGPCINQISFRLKSLSGLRAMHERLKAESVQESLPLNHGNALAFYAPDPEGNLLEFFVDSPWHCDQPMAEPYDLSASDDEILKQTEALVRRSPGFTDAKTRRRTMEERMSVKPTKV